ncbi:MAG: AAA family ATPase [Candidatus Nomurabacteria bacterium]|jgi:dephospho-CoA kinase|nr:AAA family ATPase [Candidatus Nomurabacteria bacterium]
MMKTEQIKGNFFITGRQGSGKTTVGREMRRRGYSVFDIDHTAGLGKLRELATGDLYDFAEITLRSPNGLVDWNQYWFEVQADKLREVLDSGELVFVTGIASNYADYLGLFDKVFVLIVDPEVARNRLVNHEHASHHLPSEIDRIMDGYDDKQRVLVESADNTVSIDAGGSLDDIIKAIEGKIVS